MLDIHVQGRGLGRSFSIAAAPSIQIKVDPACVDNLASIDDLIQTVMKTNALQVYTVTIILLLQTNVKNNIELTNVIVCNALRFVLLSLTTKKKIWETQSI